MATLSLFVLFGIMGLAIDLGWSYYRKQVAQTATDAAALASAVVAENSATGVITCGLNNVLCQGTTACPTITGSPANNIQNGCLYAKSNGFTNSGNQTVTMSSSASGLTPDPTKFSVLYKVTATATETNSQLFSGLLGNTSGQIMSQSTAEVVQLPEPGCIYALNPTANQALNMTGGSTNVSIVGCGAYVNSSSSNSSLVVSGGAKLTAGFVDLVGGFSLSGGSAISPTPKTGTTAVSDPLKSMVAPPQPASCDQTNYSIGSGSASLTSGTYCGGITINGSATATFGSGIYYLYGGGLTINSSGTTISGSDLMFYNTDGHGISGLPTSNYAGITLTGGANVTFSAPSTGTYSGILFFKDRSVSSSNNKDTFSGSTRPNLSGTLYFPGDALTLSGGSGIGIQVGSSVPAIIADTITFSGGSFSVQSGTGSAQYKFAALVQ